MNYKIVSISSLEPKKKLLFFPRRLTCIIHIGVVDIAKNGLSARFFTFWQNAKWSFLRNSGWERLRSHLGNFVLHYIVWYHMLSCGHLKAIKSAGLCFSVSKNLQKKCVNRDKKFRHKSA